MPQDTDALHKNGSVAFSYAIPAANTGIYQVPGSTIEKKSFNYALSGNTLTIKYAKKVYEPITLTIVTLNGKMLFTTMIKPDQQNGTLNIPLPRSVSNSYNTFIIRLSSLDKKYEESSIICKELYRR
jgi:uncharacterized membrane protein